MKFLRKYIESKKDLFEGDGKYKSLYPLYEAVDTLLFWSPNVTKSASHVRDVLDLKRLMAVVFVAVLPAAFVGFYNAGLQANMAIAKMGMAAATSWQAGIFQAIGLGFNPESFLSNFVFGLIYFVPLYVVTLAVGGFWEVLFAIVRKHEINEGFFVTSILFPLIVPPTIPLWQVALGISFGVVIGKEVFGGTGMNILNPALTARAFLFFAYPGQISGDAVWVAADGFTGATPLSIAATQGLQGLQTSAFSWSNSFWGMIPGSLGETSTFAILIGAIILIVTGIGSWRIMLSVVLGALGTTLLFNLIGSDTNPMFSIPFHWHMVLGGFAFGTVFMATDPVSAAMTEKGKYYYGALIGIMVILIRVVNPAFPEGMMLAILFGNTFSPIIDHFVMKGNIKRRSLRNG